MANSGCSGVPVGFHGERHWHGDCQVMLLVVNINLIAKIAALASLAHDHDAGVVQNWRQGQSAIRSQDAHARQSREVVSLLRGQLSNKGRHTTAFIC